MISGSKFPLFLSRLYIDSKESLLLFRKDPISKTGKELDASVHRRGNMPWSIAEITGKQRRYPNEREWSFITQV